MKPNKPAKQLKVVKTGDTSDIPLYMLIMGGAVAGICWCSWTQKRKRIINHKISQNILIMKSRRLFLRPIVTYEREYATFVMMTILINIVGFYKEEV